VEIKLCRMEIATSGFHDPIAFGMQNQIQASRRLSRLCGFFLVLEHRFSLLNIGRWWIWALLDVPRMRSAEFEFEESVCSTYCFLSSRKIS
jgi:hypothetical protein